MSQSHPRAIASILLAAAAFICLLAAAPATAPTFHWAVRGRLAADLDLSLTPIRRDAVIYYEHEFGLIPRFWKGTPERGGIPQNVNMPAHLAKLRLDIERAMPQTNHQGFGVIDLEAWGPLWIWASDEAKEMSRTQARQRHPERPPSDIERIARADYELGARTLLETTLRECRAIRPLVRWGFYGWPDPQFAPHLERLQWLWDASTAFFPVCYVVYKSAADGQHQKGAAPPAEYTDDTRSKVEICRRVAGPGKPVIAAVWVRYHEINSVLGGQFLEPPDLQTMFATPLAAGADGFVFWDVLDTPEMLARYRSYLAANLAPLLADLRRRDRAQNR